jgi:hypothetical protein
LLLSVVSVAFSVCLFGILFFFLSSVSVFFAEMSLRPNARVEVRKKGYKLAVDADEARRKREDNMVEIRKNKRDESLLKKRREGLQQPQQQLFSSSAQAVDMEKKQLESLPAMVAGVYSEDPATQLEVTTQFRKLLSIERSPPIEEVIASGVVPRFVEFLTHADFPQLQVSFSFGWQLNLDLMVHIEISALVKRVDIFVHSNQKSIFVCDAV